MTEPLRERLLQAADERDNVWQQRPLTANLLREAAAAIAEQDARLMRLEEALQDYDAACIREFGNVTIEHAGRTGQELQALIDACRAALLVSPEGATPVDQEQEKA